MTDVESIIIYSLLSGSTIFLGGLLSYYFGDHVDAGKIKSEVIHTATAFGGGLLMAAVGLVLVPEGMQALPMIFIFLSFLSGVIIFLFIDQYMEKKGGTMSQLLGMVSDFIPEAITMGAVFSKNPTLGILLATIIGIQNLPESFNAYRDLKKSYSVRVCLLILLALVFRASSRHWLVIIC